MTKFCLYAFIIAGLTLVSCNKLLKITDNEDKGVNDVLNFYGGTCKYGVGYIASTNDGNKKYFELEVGKSEVLDQLSSIPEMPASNIAYLFYRNLKDEKNNYDEIRAVLTLKGKTEGGYNYSKETLAIVDKKMAVVARIVALLKSKNFEGLKPFLNPDTTFISYNKDTLVAELARVDPQVGAVTEFIPHGFRFDKREEGKTDILHISGVLIREKQNTNFSVDLDPTSANDEIMLMRYKL